MRILAIFQTVTTAYYHNAAKRVLRYLKGTTELAIEFMHEDFESRLFEGSDYAADLIDRKSTIGNFPMTGKTIIHCGVKKQTSVAPSTYDAQYIAISVACQAILWPPLVSSFLVLA